MLEKIFRLTPLGRADGQIRDFLEMKLEEHHFERYNKALDKYRNFKIMQQLVRILLYASLLTSVAATFNVDLSVINKVASYVGLSFLFLIYGVISYFSMIYREEYHVQRDILISTAAEKKAQVLEEDINE